MIHLKKQLMRNIWSSWAGYAVRIVISFLFVPYITSVLGDARYGVWVIVFQTINYFTLLDLGLEKALVRFLSKYLGKRDFLRINRTLNTTFGLYLIAGSIIIVGAWLTATFLFDFFQIGDPSLAAEGKSVLIIIGLFSGIRFYLLPFTASLVGFQRSDISAALHTIEEIVRAAVLVWLLLNGYGMVSLALAILVVSVVRQLVAIIVAKHLYPEMSLGSVSCGNWSRSLSPNVSIRKCRWGCRISTNLPPESCSTIPASHLASRRHG